MTLPRQSSRDFYRSKMEREFQYQRAVLPVVFHEPRETVAVLHLDHDALSFLVECLVNDAPSDGFTGQMEAVLYRVIEIEEASGGDR